MAVGVCRLLGFFKNQDLVFLVDSFVAASAHIVGGSTRGSCWLPTLVFPIGSSWVDQYGCDGLPVAVTSCMAMIVTINDHDDKKMTELLHHW